MKNFLLLYFIIISSNLIYSNKIDRLKTNKDVQEFVLKIEPDFTKYNYNDYEIHSTKFLNQKLDCRGIIDKWKIKNWEKTDVNNDGKTDLLFIISNHSRDFDPYLIIDQGLKGFKSFRLSNNVFEDCELFKSIKINKNHYLKYFSLKQIGRELVDPKKEEVIDTLTFKFDDIIEYQKYPDSYTIKTIEYNTGCSDGCPIFSFKIKADGTAYYNGKWYSDVKGSRKIKVPKRKFKELENLLGYIRVKELKEKYSVPWLHGKTGYLKITFIDNSEKIIDDYGSIGTYGLSAVYRKLENIVQNEIWE